MYSGPRPDALDPRLVFKVYAGIAITLGVSVYMWPHVLPATLQQAWLSEPGFAGLPWGRSAILRTAATIVAAAGGTAAAFATVEEPRSALRALWGFAITHLVGGGMFLGQWIAVLEPILPPAIGWAPVTVGLLLLSVAFTIHTADPKQTFTAITRLFDESSPHVERLRSTYETQIAHAARQEERARLARDLHDAVKQQLFVVQTSAATVQARFETDRAGARTALDQVRTAAREATSEMEAMLEQLQATPLTTAGLVAAIRKQADALRFRTGAAVHVEIDALPPDWTLPPGTQQGLFRIAQEALSNIARHARASDVTIRLGALAGQLTLAIRDDGAGFDQERVLRGLGSESMRARVDELQGRFSLQSRPGSGTSIRVSVPYETATPQEYRRKALGGAAALVAFAALVWWESTNGEFHTLLALYGLPALLIVTARYAAGYRRLRRRVETAA